MADPNKPNNAQEPIVEGTNSTATTSRDSAERGSTTKSDYTYDPNFHDPLESSVVDAVEVGKNIADFTKGGLAGAQKAVDTFLGFVGFEGEEGGAPAGDETGEKAGAKPKADATAPVYESTKPTPKELDWFKDSTVAPETIEKIKEEINKFGRDPKTAISEAADKTRILGLGEWHVSPNGLRTLAETMMPEFQKKGFTHLAVEIHKDNQDVLDRFAKGDKKAAEQLKSMYGGLHDDSLAMMKAAADAGIKLVAVDGNYPAPNPNIPPHAGGGGGADELDQKELQARDNLMSANISKIVEDDPKAKVLFVVGAKHLEVNDGTGKDKYRSTAQQVRERGKDKGYDITTFGSHMDQEQLRYFTTPPLAGSASHAVSVETAKTVELKKFPAANVKDTPEIVGRHDHAVFFPRDSALKIMETEFGKESPRLIPALDSLAKFQFGPGKNDKAGMEFLQRALEIEKKSFGPESKEVADRLMTIAGHSSPEEALKLKIQSLAIREKLAGEKPTPEVMDTIADIVDLQFKNNNRDEALKYFNKGADKLAKGGADEETLNRWTFRSYGTTRQFVDAKDPASAIEVLKRVADQESKHGDHQDTVRSTYTEIAKLSESMKDPKQAEKYYRAALEEGKAFAKKNGINDDRLTDARIELATFLERTGRPADAEPLYKENLEKAQGEKPYFKDSSMIRAQTWLLHNAVLQKQPEKASEYFDAAFKLHEKGVHAYGIRPEKVFDDYTKFLEDSGKKEKAQKVRDRISDLAKKKAKADDEDDVLKLLRQK